MVHPSILRFSVRSFRSLFLFVFLHHWLFINQQFSIFYIIIISIDLRFGTQTFNFEISLFSPYSASSAPSPLVHLSIISVIFISLFGSIHHLFGAALGIYHLWFVGGWSGGLAGLNYIACSDRIRRLCIPLRYSILDYISNISSIDIYYNRACRGSTISFIFGYNLQYSILQLLSVSKPRAAYFVCSFTFILSLSSTAVCCFLC